MDLAGLNRGLHRRLLDVGVDHGHAEGEAVLAGDLGDDLAAPGQVRGGAGPARRAHHHRHPQPQALDEHPLQIPLHQRAMGERLAAAEVIRPRIGRAGVAGDQVRRASRRRGETTRSGKP